MIVLIEDSQLDVFLIKAAIAAHCLDIELHVLKNGEQATGFIAQVDSDDSAACPRLFLLDLNLPRTGGLEVLSCLRKPSGYEAFLKIGEVIHELLA